MSTKCWDIRNKGDKVYSVNLEKGESQWENNCCFQIYKNKKLSKRMSSKIKNE